MYVPTNVCSELTSRASRSNENVEICTRGRFIRSNVYSTALMLPTIRKLRHGRSLPICDGKFPSAFLFGGGKNFLRSFMGALNVNAFRSSKLKKREIHPPAVTTCNRSAVAGTKRQ